MKPPLLIWSDKPDLYLWLGHILNHEGLRAKPVNGDDVIESAKKRDVLGVLFDVEDKIDEICRLSEAVKKERSNARMPLLAILPSGNENAYLQLLKSGIDECFVRPVSPARILNYLQSVVVKNPHLDGPAYVQPELRQIGEMELDNSKRLVKFRNETIQLSSIEFRLLSRLLEEPGRAIAREELIDAGWPPNYFVQPRTVDVHIGRVRRTLRKITGRSIIRTVRQVGYAAEVD